MSSGPAVLRGPPPRVGSDVLGLDGEPYVLLLLVAAQPDAAIPQPGLQPGPELAVAQRRAADQAGLLDQHPVRGDRDHVQERGRGAGRGAVVGPPVHEPGAGDLTRTIARQHHADRGLLGLGRGEPAAAGVHHHVRRQRTTVGQPDRVRVHHLGHPTGDQPVLAHRQRTVQPGRVQHHVRVGERVLGAGEGADPVGAGHHAGRQPGGHLVRPQGVGGRPRSPRSRVDPDGVDPPCGQPGQQRPAGGSQTQHQHLGGPSSRTGVRHHGAQPAVRLRPPGSGGLSVSRPRGQPAASGGGTADRAPPSAPRRRRSPPPRSPARSAG